eukprot:TRINITY_DN3047_c0_g2_i1.p1 TRINITY_DN3047_c0_g2~~TRINITY_DN3047_c0_g2_i1.p1  ORF type:complete len:240 (+),score=81.78 TRINITY_DN3047_c0_g2_i1:72-722(+)
MQNKIFFTVTFLASYLLLVSAQVNVGTGSKCVGYVNPPPPGMFPPTGTWSIAAFVKDPNCIPIHVAGMRGINASTNTQISLNQVNGLTEVVRGAFENMLTNAATLGASKYDCAEILVFARKMPEVRTVVNAVQTELWGAFSQNTPVHPPRTIIAEVTFNGAVREVSPGVWVDGAGAPANSTLVGDVVEVKGTFYVRKGALKKALKDNLDFVLNDDD